VAKSRKNGSNKLTESERATMFASWCRWKPEVGEYKAYDRVAKACRVCITTVKKYRKLDNWDERYERNRQAAIEQLDYDIVKETANNLRLIRKGKDVWEDQLKSIGLLERVRLKDIADLLRIELLLAGEPDSHEKIDIEIQNELNNLTTEELRSLIKASRNRSGKA